MTSMQHPICLSCGYALTGLAKGACPECGRVFDIADPASVGPLRHPWLTAIAGSAVHWAFVIPLAIGALAFSVFASAPGPISDDFMIVLIGVHAIAVAPLAIWCLLTLLARAALVTHGERQPRWRAQWLILLAAWIAFFTLGLHGWAFKFRWWLARDQFIALEQRAVLPTAPCRIGTFFIEKAERKPCGTWRLHLGFPDWDPPGDMTLEIGVTAGVGWPVDVSMSDGWYICWDPT